MCTTSSPKVKDPVEKKPVYMSNPYLDGLGIGAEGHGRNSLRIDAGSPVPTSRDVYRPPRQLGGGGGGGGDRGGLPHFGNGFADLLIQGMFSR